MCQPISKLRKPKLKPKFPHQTAGLWGSHSGFSSPVSHQIHTCGPFCKTLTLGRGQGAQNDLEKFDTPTLRDDVQAKNPFFHFQVPVVWNWTTRFCCKGFWRSWTFLMYMYKSLEATSTFHCCWKIRWQEIGMTSHMSCHDEHDITVTSKWQCQNLTNMNTEIYMILLLPLSICCNS